MPDAVTACDGALERAIALVRLTQGRVGEDHLFSARQSHAAASLHGRADSSSRNPTTVGSRPSRSDGRPSVRARVCQNPCRIAARLCRVTRSRCDDPTGRDHV